MIGERALGEKIAKRIEDYADAWSANAGTAPGARERAAIVEAVLRSVAGAIRDVTK